MEQVNKSKFSTEVRKHMDTTLAYIKDQLTKHLVPFNRGPPFHELFVFDDVRSVRQHIMGAPRAVIHNALQNPQIYLQVRIHKCNTISLQWRKTFFFFKFPSVFLLYLRRSLTNTTVATRHIDCIQITSRKRSDDKLVWLAAGKVTHFFKCFVSHSLNRPFLLLWIGIQYHSSSGSRPRVERNWTGNSVS